MSRDIIDQILDLSEAEKLDIFQALCPHTKCDHQKSENYEEWTCEICDYSWGTWI